MPKDDAAQGSEASEDARRDISGDITGVASFELSGSGTATFPKVSSIQVPPIGGSFHLKSDGLSVNEVVRFEGADFRFKAGLKSLTDWSVDGSARVDGRSTEIKPDGTLLATVAVKQTDVTLKATPSWAGLTAKGGFAIHVPWLGTWAERFFDVSFEGGIVSDDRAVQLVIKDVPDPGTAFVTRKDVTVRIPILTP